MMSDTAPVEETPVEQPRELSSLPPVIDRQAWPDTDTLLAELHNLTEEEGTAQPPETSEETTAPSVEEAEEEGGTATDTPVALPPPGTIEIEGRAVPIEEVKALLALGDRLRTDEPAAKAVQEALRPTPTTADETDASEDLPPWLDPDSAEQVRAWNRMKELESNMARSQQEEAANRHRQRQAEVADAWNS